jgi:hypothetical protein
VSSSSSDVSVDQNKSLKYHTAKHEPALTSESSTTTSAAPLMLSSSACAGWSALYLRQLNQSRARECITHTNQHFSLKVLKHHWHPSRHECRAEHALGRLDRGLSRPQSLLISTEVRNAANQSIDAHKQQLH